MSALTEAVNDYLRVRRTLGYKLTDHGTLLPDFVAYLEAAGASTVTTELAVAWATQPTGTTQGWWGRRLAIVGVLATSRPSTPTPRCRLLGCCPIGWTVPIHICTPTPISPR